MMICMYQVAGHRLLPHGAMLSLSHNLNLCVIIRGITEKLIMTKVTGDT